MKIFQSIVGKFGNEFAPPKAPAEHILATDSQALPAGAEPWLPMRWHCLQHVPFETPGHLATWVQHRGHALTRTELWREAAFPHADEYDGLFILGGPMNVYEVDEHPWLASEEHFIARAVCERKPIVGVCLGAQLLAVILGGSVTENLDREIGWFPIDLTPAGRDSVLFRDFPDRFTAFHWHGDCFSIPPRAIHAARSEACEQQAFVYENHVVGLQFHLESDEQGVAAMIQHCGEDMGCGQHVQDAYAIEDCGRYLPAAHDLLDNLLDNLVRYSRELAAGGLLNRTPTSASGPQPLACSRRPNGGVPTCRISACTPPN